MAQSNRGSHENLFSISGASEALGRARRTITRALKGIPPDAVRHGLSLWRMQTIIRAVNENTQAPILTNTDGELAQLCVDATVAFKEFDDAMDALMKLKTVKARRAAAHKMVPLLNEMVKTMWARDIADDLHEQIRFVARAGSLSAGCERG
jgi:hypothetical protein